MKQIIKNKPPKSFVEYCAKPFSLYYGSGFPKERLRQSLLEEQGNICCYCMKRIPEKVETDGRIRYDMKIEHFKPQDSDKFPELQLTYTNLFGACTGNEGQPKIKKTCDTKKGNRELTINPTSISPNCEALFKYNSEGEISSIDGNFEVDRQLNDILNLNMQTLKEGRSEIYLEIQNKIRVESKNFKKDKASFIRLLEQERINWLNRADNKYKPFCMVAVYYLTKKKNKAKTNNCFFLTFLGFKEP